MFFPETLIPFQSGPRCLSLKKKRIEERKKRKKPRGNKIQKEKINNNPEEPRRNRENPEELGRTREKSGRTNLGELGRTNKRMGFSYLLERTKARFLSSSMSPFAPKIARIPHICLLLMITSDTLIRIGAD